MSLNFLDTVSKYIDNRTISSAASYLGESEFSIKKGLEVIVPLSLAGITQKMETGNPETVLNLARLAYDSGIINNFSAIFSPAGGGIPKSGPGLISGILGDNFGSIANAVASHSNLKGATSASLFGTIIPLALAILGRYAVTGNIPPGNLATMLGGQKSTILSALPPGIDGEQILGAPITIKENRDQSSALPATEKKGNRLLPILLGLAALAVLFYLVKSCNNDSILNAPPIHADSVVITKTDTILINTELIKVILPNGIELNAYKGGIEDLLVAFLNSQNTAGGKDNWFDFNDLNFTFGTSEIVPESRTQITNIVEILKAFPKTKIKLGGYTDKVGNEDANKKLSGERALAVANALRAEGVGTQVISEEGYGSAFAKYPADAPEADRIKDRRVSISVREK